MIEKNRIWNGFNSLKTTIWTFLCCLHYSPFTTWFCLHWAAIWHYFLIPDSSFVGTEGTKLFRLCTNKAFPALYQQSCSSCVPTKFSWYRRSVSKCEISAFKYLYTYKKRICFFWKNSVAVAKNWTQIAQTEVWCLDHYTITAWMKLMSSMDQLMPLKPLVLMILGQWPHHGLWPLTSSLIQNDIGK